MFWKLQEILYVIGTKNFQIDLLEAEKIRPKDGNSTYKNLEKIEKILLDWTDFLGHPVGFKFAGDFEYHKESLLNEMIVKG